MQLRSWHGTSAVLVAAYAAMHIANHLTAVYSVDLHLATMALLRKVYRQPLIEALLLAAVAFQAGSGLVLAIRGWAQRRGGVAWVQAASGIYLAFFLLIHVAAVLYGRAALHLDTNFYYAAAGLHIHPYEWFFAPYYALAVVAIFTHLSCAAYWMSVDARPSRARTMLQAGIGAGLCVSALIMLAMAGAFAPLALPAEYQATYGVR